MVIIAVDKFVADVTGQPVEYNKADIQTNGKVSYLGVGGVCSNASK